MTTKEKIKVMQAFDEGKLIQMRLHGSAYWGNAHTPKWNWGSTEYRIKPQEPKIIYVYLHEKTYNDWIGNAYNTPRNTLPTTKFIEVMDDDTSS